MQKGIFIAFVLLAWPVSGQNSKPSGLECYCTDGTGARVELGELRCLRVDGRNYTARCEMSLNNPMWREVQNECVAS
ncbi:MAG: hypothetical protein AAF826_01505 [Pseudomonadota bacterium]